MSYYPENATLVAFRSFQVPMPPLGVPQYPVDSWDAWLDYKYETISQAAKLVPSFRACDEYVGSILPDEGHYAHLKNSFGWFGLTEEPYFHHVDPGDSVSLAVWIVLNDEQPLAKGWAAELKPKFMEAFSEFGIGDTWR